MTTPRPYDCQPAGGLLPLVSLAGAYMAVAQDAGIQPGASPAADAAVPAERLMQVRAGVEALAVPSCGMEAKGHLIAAINATVLREWPARDQEYALYRREMGW